MVDARLAAELAANVRRYRNMEMSLDDCLNQLRTECAYGNLQVTKTYLLDLVKREYDPPPRWRPPVVQEEYEIELWDVSDQNATALWNDWQGDHWIYVPEWDRWIYWNGTVWEKDTDKHTHIQQSIYRWSREYQFKVLAPCLESLRADLRELLTQKERGDDSVVADLHFTRERIKAVKKALDALQSNYKMKNILSRAKNLPNVAVSQDQIDIQPHLFNMQNCTYDLLLHTTYENDRDDLLTVQAPFCYDETATSWRWQAFLEKVQPDPAIRTYLQTWAGYCLTADTREHAVNIFVGNGANGKSVYLKTLMQMMGTYAKSTDFTMFYQNARENPMVYKADLRGMRFVSAIETSDPNAPLNIGLIKQLASEDSIKAREMYEKPFEFKPTFKVTVALNHLPAITEQDRGTWRRIKIVPWDVEITDEERDLTLGELLKYDLPGIFNWALEGLRRYQAEGLIEPAAITNAIEDYRREVDQFADFLSIFARTEIQGVPLKHSKLMVRAAPFFEAWQAYEDAQKVPPHLRLTQNKFGREMSQRFRKERDQFGTLYRGVELLDEGAMQDRLVQKLEHMTGVNYMGNLFTPKK